MPYTFEYDELAALVTGNDPEDEDFDAEEAICEKFEIDFIEQFMPLVDALTAYTAPLETALSGDIVQGFMRFDEVGPSAIIKVDAEGDAAKYAMNWSAPPWTTEPPAVAGFYWMRASNEKPRSIGSLQRLGPHEHPTSGRMGGALAGVRPGRDGVGGWAPEFSGPLRVPR